MTVIDDPFLKELTVVHRKVGIFSLKETIVGGKPLDIHTVYENVTKAGGFEKVSAERKWKQIASAFDFPPSCTNSAFVIKQYYQKYLLDYEKVKLHGVEIDQLGTSSQSGIADTPAPQPQIKINTQIESELKPASLPYIPDQLRTGIKSYKKPLINPDDDGKDDKYLYGFFKSRLLLALESDLPNELDWAFNKLIRISYFCPPNFHIGIIPGLLEAIIKPLSSFFSKFILNRSPNNFETKIQGPIPLSQSLSEVALFNDPDFSSKLERVCQVLHVLRNFSFLDQNAKYHFQQLLIRFFTNNEHLIECLAKGIALPSSTNYIKIKQYSVDISESLANHIELSGPNDFFLVCFKKYIFENDRSLILASVRALTRFCVNEKNQPLLENIDASIVQRLLQLMLISDEEMINSILEYLYQYSGLNPQTASQIVSAAPNNIVKFLCKFLHWKGVPQPLAQPQAAGAAALKGPPPKSNKNIITTYETRQIPTQPQPSTPLNYPGNYQTYPFMQQSLQNHNSSGYLNQMPNPMTQQLPQNVMTQNQISNAMIQQLTQNSITPNQISGGINQQYQNPGIHNNLSLQNQNTQSLIMQPNNFSQNMNSSNMMQNNHTIQSPNMNTQINNMALNNLNQNRNSMTPMQFVQSVQKQKQQMMTQFASQNENLTGLLRTPSQNIQVFPESSSFTNQIQANNQINHANSNDKITENNQVNHSNMTEKMTEIAENKKSQPLAEDSDYDDSESEKEPEEDDDEFVPNSNGKRVLPKSNSSHSQLGNMVFQNQATPNPKGFSLQSRGPMPQMNTSTPIQQFNHQAHNSPLRPPMHPTPGRFPMNIPSGSYSYANQAPAQPQNIVEEIKHEVINEPEYSYQCHWQTNNKSCEVLFESSQDLREHIKQDHIFPQDNRYLCHWKGCKATHRVVKIANMMHDKQMQIGLLTEKQLENHLNTHEPLSTVTMKQVLKPYQTPTPVNRPEPPSLTGIPVTCLLVLRNIAKYSKELFKQCESDLAVILAVDVRYSKFVGQILGEIYDE